VAPRFGEKESCSHKPSSSEGCVPEEKNANEEPVLEFSEGGADNVGEEGRGKQTMRDRGIYRLEAQTKISKKTGALKKAVARDARGRGE